MNFTGGSTSQPFKVEYNVPDCQGGWAVLKDGTGQVVGCYKSESEATQIMQGLSAGTLDILGDEVRTAKSPEEVEPVKKAYQATSIWDGVFFPARSGVYGIDAGQSEQDAGWRSTYNSPPQKDGMESTGYGNRSGGTNPN